MPDSAAAQSRAVPGPAVPTQPAFSHYVQPTQTEKLHNYLFETFGPYPLAWTTIVAGYHQAKRSPPDWREGFPGFGERYGSDFGNSTVNITTRFALAEALHEDTLYYRCSCTGVWPRLEHAVVSSAFIHRGAEGHRAFAFGQPPSGAGDGPGSLRPRATSGRESHVDSASFRQGETACGRMPNASETSRKACSGLNPHPPSRGYRNL